MTTIAIQVSDDRYRELGDLAESLGITFEQLVRANVEDMLAQPKEGLQQALSHVLEKSEELYKRLAAKERLPGGGLDSITSKSCAA
jgi:hypothetical protein